MQAYRAALLRFADDGSALTTRTACWSSARTRTGARWCARRAPTRALARATFPAWRSSTCPGRILAPGFIDLHIHFPQTDVIGSPAEGLLPWLENYTFPHEARFADAAYARERGRRSSSTNCCATASPPR